MAVVIPTATNEQGPESETSGARIGFTVDLLSLGAGALLSLIVVCIIRRLQRPATRAT